MRAPAGRQIALERDRRRHQRNHARLDHTNLVRRSDRQRHHRQRHRHGQDQPPGPAKPDKARLGPAHRMRRQRLKTDKPEKRRQQRKAAIAVLEHAHRQNDGKGQRSDQRHPRRTIRNFLRHCHARKTRAFANRRFAAPSKGASLCTRTFTASQTCANGISARPPWSSRRERTACCDHGRFSPGSDRFHDPETG